MNIYVLNVMKFYQIVWQVVINWVTRGVLVHIFVNVNNNHPCTIATRMEMNDNNNDNNKCDGCYHTIDVYYECMYCNENEKKDIVL